MASSVTNNDLSMALASFDLEDSEDNREQLRVMVEAMAIYQEREKVRGALWKEAGAEDCAHNLKHKSLRVAHASGPDTMEAAVDDALDAVNYSVFYVRNVRDGRLSTT